MAHCNLCRAIPNNGVYAHNKQSLHHLLPENEARIEDICITPRASLLHSYSRGPFPCASTYACAGSLHMTVSQNLCISSTLLGHSSENQHETIFKLLLKLRVLPNSIVLAETEAPCCWAGILRQKLRDETCYLIQWQYADIGPTHPSNEPTDTRSLPGQASGMLLLLLLGVHSLHDQGRSEWNANSSSPCYILA